MKLKDVIKTMEKSLGRSITDLEFCTVITEEMLELEVANIGFDGSSVNIKFKQSKMYGDGKQVRDWLHVNDHCAAIYAVLHKGIVGQIYNVGGNNEKANIEIVKLIISTLGKSEELIKYVKDRPGHDKRYAIDNTKITTQLGWTPTYTFEVGMKETIEWYLENKNWIDNIVSGSYEKYYKSMYRS